MRRIVFWGGREVVPWGGGRKRVRSVQNLIWDPCSSDTSPAHEQDLVQRTRSSLPRQNHEQSYDWHLTCHRIWRVHMQCYFKNQSVQLLCPEKRTHQRIQDSRSEVNGGFQLDHTFHCLIVVATGNGPPDMKALGTNFMAAGSKSRWQSFTRQNALCACRLYLILS